MIDRTTLPIIPAGTAVPVGQRFLVGGRGLLQWPNEMVLSYSEEHATTAELPSIRLMKLVSKTDTLLVFESTQQMQFSVEHVWSYFAAGFEVPRTILQYVEE